MISGTWNWRQRSASECACSNLNAALGCLVTILNQACSPGKALLRHIDQARCVANIRCYCIQAVDCRSCHPALLASVTSGSSRAQNSRSGKNCPMPGRNPAFSDCQVYSCASYTPPPGAGHWRVRRQLPKQACSPTRDTNLPGGARNRCAALRWSHRGCSPPARYFHEFR